MPPPGSAQTMNKHKASAARLALLPGLCEAFFDGGLATGRAGMHAVPGAACAPALPARRAAPAGPCTADQGHRWVPTLQGKARNLVEPSRFRPSLCPTPPSLPACLHTLPLAVLFGMPVLLGFTLGFIMKAVGPGLVVPEMFRLEREGYGREKGEAGREQGWAGRAVWQRPGRPLHAAAEPPLPCGSHSAARRLGHLAAGRKR